MAYFVAGCGQSHVTINADKTTTRSISSDMTIEKITKTDAEWQKPESRSGLVQSASGACSAAVS